MGVKYITALEALCYAARDLPNHEAGTLTRLRTSLALAAAVAAGAGWLAWQAARDPEIPWLARHRPAEWILYPSAPSSSAHPAIRLDTVFRRAFELRQRPHGARLEARCFRACQVAVNGAPLAPAAPPAPRASSAPPAAAIWKDSFVADAAPLLRKGVNVVVVRVANGGGPPALWLSLAVADGPTVPANRLAARVQDARSPKREPASYPIVSDGRWEASLAGAAWRAARLATTPMSRWGSAGTRPLGANPRPAAAAAANLPLLLVFAALGAVGLWAGKALARWPRADAKGASATGESARRAGAMGAGAALAAAALLWALLFWNNRGLDGAWGFDSESHLDYLRAVLEQGRLPLADEGWEMYQPPLYYLGAAALLRLAGHAQVDAPAIGLLRALGWCALVVQGACVLGSLRLLFPGSPRRWLGGLCLGVFLPAQLYLLQYVTNEGWAAALSSAALYLCLRCLPGLAAGPDRPGAPHRPSPAAETERAAESERRESSQPDPPPLPFVLLGAVLGLAMLTKFSALVTLAAVTAVLAGRLAALRVRAAMFLRTVGAMLLGCLVVCGWHYARVAAHFHRVLVGNWDRASGFGWWQDPGYRTSRDLLRWGESLRAPLLSAMHSIPDALYSTLWGDGLLGGSGLLAVRPPWNYGLLAAGYLLALLPAAALLVGVGAAAGRLARQPRATDLLLAGTLGATVLAVLAMSLRVASYAQPKAFYALSALVPLCAFGGWGLDLIAGAGTGGRITRLRAWAVYALFGVWGCNAYATFWVRHADPGPLRATAAALDPAGLLARARAAASPAEEEAWLRRATVAAPDHPFAWLLLADALARQGKSADAEAALREALRVDPHGAPAHLHLGKLLELSGRGPEAAYHLRLATLLQEPRNDSY